MGIQCAETAGEEREPGHSLRIVAQIYMLAADVDPGNRKHRDGEAAPRKSAGKRRSAADLGANEDLQGLHLACINPAKIQCVQVLCHADARSSR